MSKKLEEFRDLGRIYVDFFSSTQRVELDASKIPDSLQKYTAVASFWGVTDDLERERLIDTAPDDVKDNLTEIIEEIDDDLDDWLAGPDADNTSPTKEYLAFSAMRMAADFI